ncbi:hypothetical protein N5923_18190 [Erwiniaceae bacterium BAC15a-03b]|uniref:Uncharacterized protein n=1 Tax=Winslowiella arboricola TaxID=2978220 RepID=A0A9J6PV71_9GAMM|nr:hypothetical protein [Winslowiella arboricola]MCU5775733.1 hypothetical protein [Winslowiella arboricola]MCU5779416.1 hypothetical protein [Winslowiella arboricola]
MIKAASPSLEELQERAETPAGFSWVQAREWGAERFEEALLSQQPEFQGKFALTGRLAVLELRNRVMQRDACSDGVASLKAHRLLLPALMRLPATTSRDVLWQALRRLMDAAGYPSA